MTLLCACRRSKRAHKHIKAISPQLPYDVVQLCSPPYPPACCASQDCIVQAKPPILRDTDRMLPGFLWYLWAKAGKQHLRGVPIADSLIMINGRAKAWVFYSKKAGRVRTTGHVTTHTARLPRCRIVLMRRRTGCQACPEQLYTLVTMDMHARYA